MKAERGSLRIGYLVQQFSPEVGAGPARVAEMGRRWRAAGAEVTVITAMPNRPEGRIHEAYRGRLFTEEEWDGFRVLRSWLFARPAGGFASTLLNNLSFMATSALHAVFRARRLDVIIASSPPFFVHLSGEAYRLTRRIPLVLELRDLWPDYLVGMNVLRGRLLPPLLFALERYLLSRAAHVVTVTESFRERIAGKGVPPQRISVLPNGVDTDFYRPLHQVGAGEQGQDRGGKEFVVGYLGNFGAGQGLENVLDAAALLAESAPGVRLVLVGDGPRKGVLEEKAASLRNVSIQPPIPKEETPAFYAACDLCIVPLAPYTILQETVPSKLFEIMASEAPLLASVEGEAAALVRRSGGGMVVPPGDARAVADGILRLRSTPQEDLRAMGRRARAFVQREFARDAISDRYLEVLERVARGQDGKG